MTGQTNQVYLGGVAAYSSGAVLSCVNSESGQMQYVPVGGDPMMGLPLKSMRAVLSD